MGLADLAKKNRYQSCKDLVSVLFVFSHYLIMGGIAGGGEKQDKENGVLIIRNSFPQLVDVDNLQAVHFGNIDQWLEVRE